jgi:hypothetical protein
VIRSQNITELSKGSFLSIRILAVSSITPTPIPSLHQLSSIPLTGGTKTHSAAPGAGNVESIWDPSSIASLSVVLGPEGGILERICMITLVTPLYTFRTSWSRMVNLEGQFGLRPVVQHTSENHLQPVSKPRSLGHPPHYTSKPVF